jgi:hypothetical protein
MGLPPAGRSSVARDGGVRVCGSILMTDGSVPPASDMVWNGIRRRGVLNSPAKSWTATEAGTSADDAARSRRRKASAIAAMRSFAV